MKQKGSFILSNTRRTVLEFVSVKQHSWRWPLTPKHKELSFLNHANTEHSKSVRNKIYPQLRIVKHEGKFFQSNTQTSVRLLFYKTTSHVLAIEALCFPQMKTDFFLYNIGRGRANTLSPMQKLTFWSTKDWGWEWGIKYGEGWGCLQGYKIPKTNNNKGQDKKQYTD